MGPPKFDVRKWERATKAVAVPGDEAWGWTTVHNPPSYPSGSITTRCVRSNGWETPFQVDEAAKPSLSLTRFAPTPMLSARFDPHNELNGAHSTTGPREGIYKDASAKAWLNQEANRCPFAVDRRFVAGSWLYHTSYLYKSQPIPDRRYLEMHTRRPITQSKHVTYSRAKSTQQVVRLIAQKVNERAKSNGVAARAVTKKHPLRAFMSKDRDKKGYLTPSEVRDALETWNISLQHDDVDRLIDAFSYKPAEANAGFDPLPAGTAAETAAGEGQPLFDYRAFVQTLNALTNAHPLGGHAGNSWGWMT
mmetsp:Transcript_51448/g.128099  ORF Transcript_51448/g.128099 Transcript_51448/m.128099 type:complete len:306 (+) Transcript_51448:228-1145(+)